MWIVGFPLVKNHGARVVWTVHNLEPHNREWPRLVVDVFYRAWLSMVDGCIFLNKSSREAFDVKFGCKRKSQIIQHGHYCSVFREIVSSSDFLAQIGLRRGDFVIGHYGQIRAYKNIVDLLEAFYRLEGEGLRLVIAGSATGSEKGLLEQIEALAERDRRVIFHPEFVTNEELKALYSVTSLTVFPYSKILNSGSAILSLSMNTPVLVAEAESLRDLYDEVGAGSIFFIRNDLLSEIQRVLGILKGASVTRSIDMSMLDWGPISRATYEFYVSLLK